MVEGVLGIVEEFPVKVAWVTEGMMDVVKPVLVDTGVGTEILFDTGMGTGMIDGTKPPKAIF